MASSEVSPSAGSKIVSFSAILAPRLGQALRPLDVLGLGGGLGFGAPDKVVGFSIHHSF
jgi:hypothetical protein